MVVNRQKPIKSVKNSVLLNKYIMQGIDECEMYKISVGEFY